jgi:hypothetical protein
VNRIGLLSLLAVSSVISLIAGCSKDPPPAQQPQSFQGQYPPPQGGYPQQPGQPGYQPQPGYQQPPPGGQAGYPQPAPGQPGQPAPSASGGFPSVPGFPAPAPAGGGSASGTAQVIDPNLAALATGPLTIFANSEAPGMAKEGPTVAGNFQTGQTLEQAFTFQPGKCYTVLAVGAGVTEIDIEMQYVTPIPGVNPSIGKDSQKGAQASIGGKGNCLKPLSPIATNAKFIVRATSGAGVAAAQLYSK